MVVELGMPVTLAGLFIAIPLLVAPVRVWLGHQSDTKPINGLRREPYIIVGVVLSGVGAVTAIALVLQTPALFSLGSLIILMMLIIYGVGRNLSNNTFQALIADRFETGAPRSRAATLYEVVRMVGLIVTAGLIGKMLQPYSAERLTNTVIVLGIGAVVLSIIATIKQEPRYQDLEEIVSEDAGKSFNQILKEVVFSDKQVILFFVIVFLTLLGTQIQDVLLEPYGGLFFGMTVEETTQLTAFWGLGSLIAMLVSGIYLIKQFGFLRIFRLGLLMVAVMFVILAGLGVVGDPGLLRISVLALGFGTGLAAASLLVAVVEFTTFKRAGLLLGVWGVAHQLGRAAANIVGGGLVDSVSWLTGNTWLAYSTAFLSEGVLLVLAFVLIGRLHISQSQAVQQEIKAPPIARPLPVAGD
jgi:BCD family chlorophyll transporter-like MFS transporter